MTTQRFSKAKILGLIEARFDKIVKEQGFDLHNGTSQLKGDGELIDRAIEYGRMTALRQIADAIERGDTQ